MMRKREISPAVWYTVALQHSTECIFLRQRCIWPSVAISLLWGFIIIQMGIKRGFPADLLWRRVSAAGTGFPVPYHTMEVSFDTISAFTADGPWILFTVMYLMTGIGPSLPLPQGVKLCCRHIFKQHVTDIWWQANIVKSYRRFSYRRRDRRLTRCFPEYRASP